MLSMFAGASLTTDQAPVIARPAWQSATVRSMVASCTIPEGIILRQTCEFNLLKQIKNDIINTQSARHITSWIEDYK